MFRPLLCLTVVLLLCEDIFSVQPPDPSCAGAVTRSSFDFSILSVKNDSGEWVSKVEGRRSIDERTSQVEMDFKNRVVECAGKLHLHFQGTFGQTPNEDGDRLRFHPKCGKNAAITNKGRTIEKLNGEERLFGVAFTHRPLRLNELFEVVIEKKEGSKFNYYMGIGITTRSPEEGETPNHINAITSGTWVLYHNNIYNNGPLVMKDRKINLDRVQVGDRVGLMRTESGTLSFFYNGKEEPIASNIPYPVYGAFECYGDMIKVTLTS